jgi:hypothetical protein
MDARGDVKGSGDRDEIVGDRGATTLRRWLLANG